MTATEQPPIKPFVLTRVFDASRDLVFKAWTERERMNQWSGPKGVAISHSTFDLRPGGMLHYCVKTPDGHKMWGKWAIREVVTPQRLVFVTSFSDAAGGLTRHPMSATWPLEMLSTVTFDEKDGKTLLTIEWLPLNPTEVERTTFDEGHESMKMGWTGMLDKLADYLAGA